MGQIAQAAQMGLGQAESALGSGINFLTAPSLLDNPAGLANQLRLAGVSGPSSLAPGESTTGMFGPSIAQRSALPMLLGGGLMNSMNSPGMRMAGTGLDALGLLAILAGGGA